MTAKRDLVVYDELTIVELDGFEGEPRFDGDGDPIGSANYLCEAYGLAPDPAKDAETPGILWTDYDLGMNGDGWRFSVLIDSREAEELARVASEAGYTVVSSEPVTEPMHYGDGNGTCAILQHPDGWVVAS